MVEKERRTERRYYFQQPAFVRLQGGNGNEVETITENVSTHGLLLRCKAPIALGSKVHVTLRSSSCLPLEGVGDVLRVVQPFAGGAFLIAVGCQTPLEIVR
jgi:PilZ domain-containing protein